MKIRFLNLLERIRSSLWFLPLCLSSGAVVLSAASARLDSLVARRGAGWLRVFLYQGDLDGARTLLGTVASSMITVAGVSFSITVVALSLASSQFGPRLLSNFMRDRGNQLVLGTFIATFLYCILALGHGRDPAQLNDVYSVSATVAILLAITSLAVLIYFIHHVASSIRAEHIVDAVARDLEAALERLIAEDGDDPLDERRAGLENGDESMAQGEPIRAIVDGFVQAVDGDGLFEIAGHEDLVIRMLCRAGHFVVAGQPLVMVMANAEITEEIATRIRHCFIIGRRRTGEQDPEYGVHQLVEVALRALSPGINDPYTAKSCIGWLCAAICRIAPKTLRSADRRSEDGTLRVRGDAITFAEVLDAAFDQIRQGACDHPSVSIRLLEALETIAVRTDAAPRRAAIRHQADMTLAGAIAGSPMQKEIDELEMRYRQVLLALGDELPTALPGFRPAEPSGTKAEVRRAR